MTSMSDENTTTVASWIIACKPYTIQKLTIEVVMMYIT